MAIEEFIMTAKEELAEEDARIRYVEAAEKAAWSALDFARSSSKDSSSDPALCYTTPFVRLESGAEVAVRGPISVSGRECKDGYAGKFALVAKVDADHTVPYAKLMYRRNYNGTDAPRAERIAYTDSTIHAHGYDETRDQEVVAAFEAVDAAMKSAFLELPVPA